MKKTVGFALALFVMLLCAGCQLSEYEVGERGPAGGIVFYDKGSYWGGWRYLEAAPSDMVVTGGGNNFVAGYYRTSDTGSNMYVNENTYSKATAFFPLFKSTGTEIGTGEANTVKLVNKMGLSAYSKASGDLVTADYAAKLCCDYVCGGYDDWFLPSVEELQTMIGYFRDNGMSLEIASFQYYWSSSESSEDAGMMEAVYSRDKTVCSLIRSTTCKIRPVRAF